MKRIYLAAILIFIISSCASQNPVTRYANTHADKEFTSWEDVGKKLDANDKKKPKEHSRKNNY